MRKSLYLVIFSIAVLFCAPNFSLAATEIAPYYWGGQINGVTGAAESADALKLANGLGLDALRIFMSPKSDEDYYGGSCILGSNLTNLAKRSDINAMLTDPNVDTVLITAYDWASFGDCQTKNYLNPSFYTADNTANIQNEYKDLANYLKQFPNKKFIILNWEGDNDTQDSPAAMQGLTDWINARTAGIKASGAANVFSGMEFNYFNLSKGANLLSAVMPNVNADYYSYSAYESTNVSADQLSADIDGIRAELSAAGKNPNSLILGEVGVSDQAKGSPAVAAAYLSGLLSVAANKNIPYAVVWDLLNSPSTQNSSNFGLYNTDGSIDAKGEIFTKNSNSSVSSVNNFTNNTGITINPPSLVGYGGQSVENNFVPGNTVEQGGFLNLYGIFPNADNTVYLNGAACVLGTSTAGKTCALAYQNGKQMNVKLENSFPTGLAQVYVKDNTSGLASAPMTIYVYPAVSVAVIQASTPDTGGNTVPKAMTSVTTLIPGIFNVAPTTLDFSALVGGNNTFLVKFFGVAGAAGDTFTATATPDWLSVAPGSGTLYPATSTEQVVVNANGFSPGVYNGAIKVSATGPDCASGCVATVAVTVTVGAAPTPPSSGTTTITNPTNSTTTSGSNSNSGTVVNNIPSTAPTLILPNGPIVNFTGAGSQTITIKGSSSSHYNLGVTSDAAWLSDKVTSNSLLGSYYGNGTIILTADVAGLATGSTHTGTLTVNSSDGTSQSISVNLKVSTTSSSNSGTGSGSSVSASGGAGNSSASSASSASAKASNFSALTGNGTNPISIAMTSPSTSTLKSGSLQSITWFYYQGAGVHLNNYIPTNLTVQLFDGTTYQITKIASLGSSTATSVPWVVPANLTPSDKYLLQVCDDNIGCAGGDQFTFVP